MTPVPVRFASVTPVLYVADLDRSVAFYEVLGFERVTTGDDEEWTWAHMRADDVNLLLATGDHTFAAHRGPVQLYCQIPDADAVRQRLEAASEPVEHLGYPDHAPGGELRCQDPDGHVVMVSQPSSAVERHHAHGVKDARETGSAGSTDLASSADPAGRASVLRRAADAVRQRGGTTGRTCEVGERGGATCPSPAEVKLTDTWGDSAWACLAHADEAVFTARGVYLASEDGDGLGTFLSRRRRTARSAP